MYSGRGSQTFEARHIERSTMTEEPDTIETGIDAFDFEIKQEMGKIVKSRLELLENSFYNQIEGEFESHKKSPFFHVPKDLTSIKFFDNSEPFQKWSRNKIGIRNTIRKTMRDLQVSIHNSNFKLNHSKKLSEGGIRRKNKSRLTLNGRDTNNENSPYNTFASGNITGTATFSELIDHIENEMKKFEIDLKGSKMELVISKEEYKVF